MSTSKVFFSRLFGHLFSALLAGLLIYIGGFQPTPTAAQTLFSSQSSLDGNSVPEQLVNQPCTACEPFTVQTADLDGDDDQDVVSGSEDDGKIAWHENLGEGEFSSQNVVKENPITAPKAVDLGDLDGDGNIDILSAEGRAITDEDDELVWYENDGSGNFSAGNTIRDIGFIGGARLEDLDNDDDGDIIATANGNLVWYRNTDSGFATPDTIQADFQGRFPSITDLNGDGYKDLLRGSSSRVIWTENLDGQGFASPDTLISSLDQVVDLASTDLDSDGDQDILLVNLIRGFSSDEYEVAWLEQQDGGGFSEKTVITDNLNVFGGTLSAADLEGDGDKDIVVGSIDPKKIQWLRNDGSESFAPAETITTGPSREASTLLSLHLANLDGDDDTDVLSSSAAADQIAWYESKVDQGEGVVPQGAINTLPDIQAPESVYPADLNGDDKMDVLASSSRAGKIVWYENVGGGFAGQDTISTTVPFPTMVRAANLAGDEDPEVLTASVRSPSDQNVVWYEKLDGGGFSKNVLSAGANARVVDAADLDSDGDLDILAAGEKIVWFENLDSGGFSNMSEIADASRGALSLETADLDGDDDPEILAGLDRFRDVIAWYDNLDDGGFSSANEISASRPLSLDTKDLDGDGDPDLLAAMRSSDEIIWFENLDDGGFSSENIITDDAPAANSVYADDLDGDGSEDVLSTSLGDNRVAWYDNLDSGGFSEQKLISDQALGPEDVVAADLTGDSSPDVISASRNDDKIAWYKNTAVRGGPQAPSALSATVTDAPAAELTWTATEDTVAKYRVYRDTASITGSPDDLAPVDSVASPDTTLTDTAAAGDTYYYRVTAVDTAGTESGFSGEAQAFLYPSEVTASADRSFGDASDSTDYRLVALPGQVDRPLADAVSGEAGTGWRAYYDDGSETDFLVRYDSGSDDFTFEAGNGFWLTATSNWTSDISVSTVELQGDTAATIPLRPGWNVISNPTGKDVAWSRVQAQTPDTLQAIYGFDGTFSQADTFRSAGTGVAYYFLNDDSSRTALTIPYPGAPGVGGAAAAKDTEPPLLALSAWPAVADDAPRSTVRLGLDDQARAGLGPEDLVAPPGRFAETSLRLRAPGTPDSKRARFLMTERRPADGDGQTFTLRLTHRADGPVQFRAEYLDALNGRSVAVLNPSTGTSHDLRTDGPITISPTGETTTLKVAVGSEAYVGEKTNAVRPEEVTLVSYPNPVRRKGTIAYALPERTEVTLRIYDVLGRQVATLASGQKEAGRYTVTLNTDRLSSGLYFGRLRAGEQTRTQKITVVR